MSFPSLAPLPSPPSKGGLRLETLFPAALSAIHLESGRSNVLLLLGMDTTSKSYSLPVESIAGLKIADHLADLRELSDFLALHEVQVKNTRIDRYIRYLSEYTTTSPGTELSIFKNSNDPRFRSSGDWLLYVLREVHELMWILRGMKLHSPAGVARKLEIIVNGRDFAALDGNSLSRDTQFELRIASYFCQAGYEVDLTTETDIICVASDHAIFLECKRIASGDQFERRLLEAKKQLKSRMPPKYRDRTTFGIIAADVTKLAFAHNGLTMGLTELHAKDIIQEKFKSLVDDDLTESVFRKTSHLLQCWLQIHIPCLIINPPTTITRFSSYFLLNSRYDKHAARILRALDMMHKMIILPDKREIPAQPLEIRTTVNFPAGTVFHFEEDVLREVLEGLLVERPAEYTVATVQMSEKTFDFTFFELNMLSAGISEEKRRDLSANIDYARIALVAELYLQRHRYA